MKRQNNKKGFTLAELLIVIAIIAILIAIAIPIFSSQLRAARLSTDHANIRSAYAWAQSANLMGQADINGDGTIDPASEVAGTYATGGGSPTVTFYRDGTISDGTGTTSTPYTLMVTAKNDECQESPACNSSTNPHVQDKKITIEYESNGVAPAAESNWVVKFVD